MNRKNKRSFKLRQGDDPRKIKRITKGGGNQGRRKKRSEGKSRAGERRVLEENRKTKRYC